MNGYSVIDDKGNIDRARLSKELQDALESDIRYRQTDNMKKRAVKVAGDYKEFKEMVAAAHLKKLTKSEVESLSHVKKGWQKTVVKDKTSTPFLLGKELEEEKIRKQNEEVKLTNPGKVAASFANGELKSTTAKVKKPKSAMELERDLRRCSNDTERIIYLQEIGLKRAKSVLTSGADTDLIEELVRILLFQREQLSGTQPLESESIALDAAAAIDPAPVGSAGSSCGDPGAADSAVGPVPTNTAAEEEEDAAEGGKQRAFDCIALVKWLLALTEFDRFDMYVRFAGKQQMEQIVSTFESALTTSGELLTAKTASKIEAAVRRCRGK